VPRNVTRLVTRLVAPLVVDYFASRRLVIDYFTFAARPGASVRRAARHAARHAARRRLLRVAQSRRRLRRASRLLVSRQHWLYFEYTARCHDVVFRSHRVDHSS
jgi:hypothetical protein